MRIFVDLETKAKPRFLNHKDPRACLLTDLEQGAIQETFNRNYGKVHLIKRNINAFKMADAHGKLFKALTPPLG